MKLTKYIKKFRASLGVVEQAQIVISTSVVVTLATIWIVRLTTGQTIEALLFGTILTVGIFGFIIVFFTLKYGRLLESQKQELIAINKFVEAVNKAVDVQVLLNTALNEMQRLLEFEYGWIYQVNKNQLELKSAMGIEHINAKILSDTEDLNQKGMDWIYSTHIVRNKKYKFRSKTEWIYGDINAWVSVPIKIKDKISGLIILASKNSEIFTQKQITLISSFANQIGIALENASLFERVRKSEERYFDLFEHSPDMSHIINKSGIIVNCNQTEAKRLGYKKEELIGKSILIFYQPDHYSEAQRILHALFERNNEVVGMEEKIIAKNGEIIDVSVNASIIRDENGQPLIRAVARDITEKKRLEAKVIHAQRIDSIGNLAGGIAHDFNNILTSILGSTSIMKRKMKPNDKWYRFTDIIETAAKRGSALTRQLLTFARKGRVQFKPILINSVINETIDLFERSIDKTIEIKKILMDDVAVIKGDDGQLQQSLLNLLINARDAMPNGGTITIQTSKFFVDNDIRPEIKKGEYVSISITDTGIGMDKELQLHIFDPFFTTKDRGKGTGLGLSVVYGVVNSHDGFITVQSEPNKGAKFVMYFPVAKDVQAFARATKTKKILRGTERILVVDDEKNVADVIAGMLESMGYKVECVDSGRKAITLFKKKNNFDAVILDLNMPKLNGKDTMTKIKALNKKVKIVISTGYGNQDIDLTQLSNTVDGFIQKPYPIEELSEVLRSVLDSAKKNK